MVRIVEDDSITSLYLPRNVLSIMLKLEIFDKKSDALGAYGFDFCFSSSVRIVLVVPRFPSMWTPFAPLLLFWLPLGRGTSIIPDLLFGEESVFSCKHILRN